MSETFIFKQNRKTFKFSVDLEDVELSWQEGKTIPHIRLKKCTLPAGSIMTSNHGLGLSRDGNASETVSYPPPAWRLQRQKHVGIGLIIHSQQM